MIRVKPSALIERGLGPRIFTDEEIANTIQYWPTDESEYLFVSQLKRERDEARAKCERLTVLMSDAIQAITAGIAGGSKPTTGVTKTTTRPDFHIDAEDYNL